MRKAATFTPETMLRRHVSHSKVFIHFYVPCLYISRKHQWSFCRPALLGICMLGFDTLQKELLFSPLFPSKIVITYLASNLEKFSWKGHSGSNNKQGTCIMKLIGKRLAQPSDLQRPVSCCLVITDSIYESKSFETTRLDKTVCWIRQEFSAG